MATRRVQVNLRLKPALRERLQKIADEKGVSMTREITDRLEESFKAKPFEGLALSEQAAKLAGALALVMDRAGWQSAYFLTFGQLMGDKIKEGNTIADMNITVGEVRRIYADAKTDWLGHPWPYKQARLAAAKLLELLQPDHVDTKFAHLNADIGALAATEMVSEIIHGPARPDSETEVQRAVKLRELVGDIVMKKLKKGGPLQEILDAAHRDRLGRVVEDGKS